MRPWGDPLNVIYYKRYLCKINRRFVKKMKVTCIIILLLLRSYAIYRQSGLQGKASGHSGMSQTLVSALVLSKTDHCNSLLCPLHLLEKRQKVQNSAATD